MRGRILATVLAVAGVGAIGVAQTMPTTQRVHVAEQIKAPSPGLSGPGAPSSEDGPVYTRRKSRRPGAVEAGLIPSIAPIMDLHLRDTVVRLGADGMYYMTGSVGDDIWQRADGIELWRSADLKKWDYLGVVWSFEKDGTWQGPKDFKGKPVETIWAPEIVYLKSQKTYFLTYSMPPGDRGILKSISGKPEGPYVNALANDGKLPGEIDLMLFEDDDGKVYAAWGPCLMARMKDDMSGLAEEPRVIKVTDPDLNPAHHANTCPERRGCLDVGREGASIFKRNGKYYMTGADTYEGRYSSLVAMSDNIYGPYSKRHEAVPCGGGTNYFEDKDGNWWCAYFGNDGQAPFREMPALIKVDFDADGKVKIADEQPAWVLTKGAKTKWKEK